MTIDQQQSSQPRVATWTVGGLRVDALSDGLLRLPVSRFVHVPEARPAVAADVGSDTLPIPVNAFLVRGGGETVLMDAGCGAAFGERAGHLLASLSAAGVLPGDITAILMTHLHVDHAAGLSDAQGRPVFPSAALYVAQAEADYWRALGRTAANPDLSLKAALAALQAYAGRLHEFSPGAILPGDIESVPLPGHTPGHTGFRVADGGERLLVWGDIIHCAALQCARPEFGYAADADGELGMRTRRTMFAQAAADNLAIAGMHLPFPGAGRVTAQGDGYRFVARA